jgi:DNA-binding MarR family transcriptional regulator
MASKPGDPVDGYGDPGSDKESERLFENGIMPVVRMIMQALETDSKRLLAESGLTIPQLLTLNVLANNHESSTATELAAAIYSSPSTMVGILDRLEGKGFIDRCRETADRRRTRVTVTLGGSAALETAIKDQEVCFMKFLKGLPAEDKDRICRVLQVLISTIDGRCR